VKALLEYNHNTTFISDFKFILISDTRKKRRRKRKTILENEKFEVEIFLV